MSLLKYKNGKRVKNGVRFQVVHNNKRYNIEVLKTKFGTSTTDYVSYIEDLNNEELGELECFVKAMEQKVGKIKYEPDFRA